MTVAVIDNFLYGYLVVAMVLLAESTLGGADAVGWLNAGLSVGALAAMAVVNRLAAHSRPAPLLFAVMTVFAVATGLGRGQPVGSGDGRAGRGGRRVHAGRRGDVGDPAAARCAG